jgi:antitoxin (DNA-binding transcriptional repressor) of toxin-antitoxin stability system
MPTLSIDEVQARLSEVIDQLRPGDEVVITRGDLPVARLKAEWPVGVPIPGRCRGMLTIVSEDDDHLKDFAEYME